MERREVHFSPLTRNRPFPALQGCARACLPPHTHTILSRLWGTAETLPCSGVGARGREGGRPDSPHSGAQRPGQRGLAPPRRREASPPNPGTSGQRRVPQRMDTATTRRRIYTHASKTKQQKNPEQQKSAFYLASESLPTFRSIRKCSGRGSGSSHTYFRSTLGFPLP